MKPSHLSPIDALDAGFRPSETLVQTSVMRVGVTPGLIADVLLHDNPPTGAAPAGYRLLDVLVVENPSHVPVEFGPIAFGQDVPAHWTAPHTVGPGLSLRLAPSGLSATDQPLLLRSVGGRGEVVIRRGRATVLAD